MFKIYLVPVFLGVFCFSSAHAQSSVKKTTPSVKKAVAASKPKSPNVLIYENALKDVEKLPTLTETFVEMSKHFMGHDAYQIRSGNDAVTDNHGRVELQKIGREVLFVNLEIFDCQSFIENTLALTYTKRLTMPTYDAFREQIKKLRYRNSVVSYGARLHYFSDWIYTHQKQGLLRDVSKEIGGELYEKQVHYMSSKRDTFYGNMADPATFTAVRQVEKDLSAREKYYIAKDKLAASESQIKDGDIIAITNATDGMDIAHVGVAYWQGTQLHLLHASSDLGAVVVTNEPLSTYLATHRKHTGIMVARLVD